MIRSFFCKLIPVIYYYFVYFSSIVFSSFSRNRIALLQKEEERARKKVDQTKLRALDILSLREENEMRTKEWMDAAANEQKTREEIYRKNAEMEEQSRIVKKKQIEAVFRKKKEDVDHVSYEKLQLREEMLKMKELDIKRKQQMRTEVRLREEEARRRRDEEKRLHEQRIRQFYERKAKQEEVEAMKAEKLVKRLEKKEREWIEKLRAAQQIQENAFHNLETALSRQAESPNGQSGPEGFGGPPVSSNETGNGNGNGNGVRLDPVSDSGRSPMGRSASGSLSQRDDVRKKPSTGQRGGRKPSSS
jgi:hypothetical protein